MEISNKETRDCISRLKKNQSLCSISIDMGISESSLYKFMNDYGKMNPSTVTRIKNYVINNVLGKPLIFGNKKEMKYSQNLALRGPEILAEGLCMDYHFMIVNYQVHPCCYVKIPASHASFGLRYDEVDIECHGGLTYSDNCFPCKSSFMKNNKGWVFGWDYSHFGDFHVYESFKSTGRLWTTDELIKEVQRVSIQLKEMENIKVYL